MEGSRMMPAGGTAHPPLSRPERLAMLRQPERLEILYGLREIRPQCRVGGRRGWRERGEMNLALDQAPHGA